MKGLAMRVFMAFAVGIGAACATTTNAAFTVASNAPLAAVPAGDYMTQAGTFSDALSSGGTNFYGLGLAQGFANTVTHTLDHLTVWGASDYSGSDEPWLETSLSSNITGFQAVLMKQTGAGVYTNMHTWNIGIGAVTQTLTGNYRPNSLSPAFQLSMDLTGAFSVGPGIYYLAFGAVLADGDGDAWSWTNGEWDGTDVQHRLLATTGDTATSWGEWSSVPDGTSSAFLLESDIVPAPGALALLAIGTLVGGNRRRR